MDQWNIDEVTFDKITRFEVIDENGRVYVRGAGSVKIQLSFQDDGRTLKIFVEPRENMN